uniref:Uncharacterized protein n=1 Tax=Molossus molossus TaxID=27622 RepID=A0A7J8FYV8_MOLMO|nr:hypothetical protein HJG59_008214 [Molossus molossus]
MYKASDALAVGAAVFGFCSHSDLAQRAVLILNDMMVFRLVQCRQWLTIGDLVSNVHLWRINGDRHQGHNVKKEYSALANLAQRLEHQPAVQRDPGSVPAKGRYLGCSLSPALVGLCGCQPLDVSLSHRCCALPPPPPPTVSEQKNVLG